jgi:hypothetical protein
MDGPSSYIYILVQKYNNISGSDTKESKKAELFIEQVAIEEALLHCGFMTYSTSTQNPIKKSERPGLV